MTINNINIDETLKNATKLLAEDKGLSPATKSLLEILVLIITWLANRLNLNSRNSSKPPSTGPNREKPGKKRKGNKPSGQKGHPGKTLEKVKPPDKVKVVRVDRSKLPPGEYKEVGHETRQVFDIEISRIVTEYQAQVLEDAKDKRFTATFPKGVTQAVQYGENVKAHSVYMSQFQLIPYDRVRDYFANQLGIPVSVGSIFNFNKEVFGLLEGFDGLVQEKLNGSSLVHADETGINVKGKRYWLHCTSNSLWTHFFPHQKRGSDAMNDIGILPTFRGILCHDHWKPYYKYDCTHTLCNAHHLRELTRAWEQDNQSWAKKLIKLLKEINRVVNSAGGKLESSESQKYCQRYREILKEAEKEIPPPDEANRKVKRGRLKRTKSRNL